MKARYIWQSVVMVFSFLAGTLVPIGKTQQKPPKYVDYMRVDPRRESDYVKLEREQWKPLHQERIKVGKLRSWHLFGVQFPSGSAEKYNHVTVNTFDQFIQLDSTNPRFSRWSVDFVDLHGSVNGETGEADG